MIHPNWKKVQDKTHINTRLAIVSCYPLDRDRGLLIAQLVCMFKENACVTLTLAWRQARRHGTMQSFLTKQKLLAQTQLKNSFPLMKRSLAAILSLSWLGRLTI